MSQPIVSWYESTNSKDKEVVDVIDFGVVDADKESNQKVFYIWNNRDGNEDCSKMEEVTFTTRDRNGGTGDTVGQEVEAIKDNWYMVRVDSLDETSFTPVGRGGEESVNKSGVKAVGTTGSTLNPDYADATEWELSTGYSIGQFIKPTSDNDYFYRVTKEGTSGSSEPTWSRTDGAVVVDGTVEYTAIPIRRKPAAQEILGVKNNASEDGSNAEDAGGNFIKITVYAEVPQTARSGENPALQRLSYRYV